MTRFPSLVLFLFALLAVLPSRGIDKHPSASPLPEFRTCGTELLPQEFENWLSRVKASNTALGDVSYTIPVVIHVIHNGQNVGVGDNISYAQAISQINILNEDYNKLNGDTNKVPTPFKPFASSVGVTFCPAAVDPQGNVMAEPGVHRVRRQDFSLDAPPYSRIYIDTTIKPKTIWDPNEYLNIWVINIQGGILGYATFPNPGTSGVPGIPLGTYGTSYSDGVVILNTAFGNTGIAAAPYNKGRTTTHEVGHWMGLRHISGDSQCGDDYCEDTPPQKGGFAGGGGGLNFGCPTHPYQKNSCKQGTVSLNPDGEMFMNYMDYTNDACMYMFTEDQKDRMVAILNNSPFRKNLIQSLRCNAPAALDAKLELYRPMAGDSACATSFQPQVKVRNNGSATLTSFTIQYKIDAGATQNYAWTGSIPFGVSGIITLPSINIGAVGSHTIQATLVSPNGGTDANPGDNTQTVSFKRVNPLPSVLSLPYTEGFQTTLFPPSGWKYTPPNETYRWRRTALAGGFGQSSASIRMNNFDSPDDITGQRDILELPAFNFSGANSTLRLRFDVAYARWDFTTNDSLNIYISPDCGMTWDKVYAKGGLGLATAPDTEDEFIPTVSQWRKDSIGLAAYAGLSPVLMRIENVSNWGNYLYLDNINVLSNATALAPVADFTVSNDSVCVGDTIYLTDASLNGPTSWLWTLTGGNPTSSVSQNPKVVYASAGLKTITLVSTNTIGSSVAVNKTVLVSNKPEISVNNPTICPGTSVTLTASGATTYKWNTGPTTASITVSPAGTTVYNVTGTTNGCASTVNATVTVRTAPAVPVISKAGDVLTSSYATGNQWYRNGSLISGATSQNYTVTQTGNYTVVHTDANGCTSTSAAVNVTSVGIFDHIAKDFSFDVSPNPNSGRFYLELTSQKGGDFTLDVRNLLGQTLEKKLILRVGQQFRESMDLGKYGRGVYFITLEKEGQLLTKRVIID